MRPSVCELGGGKGRPAEHVCPSVRPSVHSCGLSTSASPAPAASPPHQRPRHPLRASGRRVLSWGGGRAVRTRPRAGSGLAGRPPVPACPRPSQGPSGSQAARVVRTPVRHACELAGLCTDTGEPGRGRGWGAGRGRPGPHPSGPRRDPGLPFQGTRADDSRTWGFGSLEMGAQEVPS